MNIKLQAHKGVSSECPENTMIAFYTALYQGYDVIELDLSYTLDKEIVVLHDTNINRTARTNSGNQLEEIISINNITYKEALGYDFGIYLSNKFRKEKIPLFKDVLEFARMNNIRLKIDNKIQKFPEDILNKLLNMLLEYDDIISITSNQLEFIQRILNINKFNIDYDGLVNEDILKKLVELIPYDKLTVWLPYESKSTSWVKIPFINYDLSKLVKKYARLGIWIINDYDSYKICVDKFKPYIIETNGIIKPKISRGLYDMHTHSKRSHDSKCELNDMAISMLNNGINGFAVTNHCDIEYYDKIDLDSIVNNTFSDVDDIKENYNIEILKGIEVGEGIWNNIVTNNILSKYPFDVVIGSVHAVRYKDLTIPYSRIDFGKLSVDIILEYINCYFDEIIEMIKVCDFDILAHLTCPFRYITGKYGINVNIDEFYDKIKTILKLIIDKKIALEINTSCMYTNNKYGLLMPCESILKLYKSMGGYLITIGSDAHIEINAGNYFKELKEILINLGFENIYIYRKRILIQSNIKI